MDLKLKGKRALITGSSAGIGAEIARVLAEEGVFVVVHGRNAEHANKVADDICIAGGQAKVVLGDINTNEGAAQIAADAEAALGGVDILINNAGSYPLTGWWDTPPETWLETYNTDVVAGVRLIRLLVPAMVERGWGRIIMVSSAAATMVPANYFPPYAGAKAAQTHIAGSLAVELTGSGVTANVVSPGPVATETFKENYTEQAAQAGRSTDWNDIQQWYIDSFMPGTPVNRLTTTREIADMVAFLSSPRADATTGADFFVDGGVSATGFKRQPSVVPQSASGIK